MNILFLNSLLLQDLQYTRLDKLQGKTRLFWDSYANKTDEHLTLYSHFMQDLQLTIKTRQDKTRTRQDKTRGDIMPIKLMNILLFIVFGYARPTMDTRLDKTRQDKTRGDIMPIKLMNILLFIVFYARPTIHKTSFKTRQGDIMPIKLMNILLLNILFMEHLHIRLSIPSSN